MTETLAEMSNEITQVDNNSRLTVALMRRFARRCGHARPFGRGRGRAGPHSPGQIVFDDVAISSATQFSCSASVPTARTGCGSPGAAATSFALTGRPTGGGSSPKAAPASSFYRPTAGSCSGSASTGTGRGALVEGRHRIASSAPLPGSRGPRGSSCADLWVVRPDGSGKRRLSASGVDESQSATSLYSWAPDGRSIVYRASTASSSWTSRPAEGGCSRRERAGSKHSPPGRRTVAGSCSASSAHPAGSLISSPWRRTEAGCTRCGELTRWSFAGLLTDGRSRISRRGRRTTWAGTSSSFRADGSHARRVGRASDYQTLDWSPDSSSVLFPGPRNSFEIVRADGQTKPLLTHGGDDPDWGL